MNITDYSLLITLLSYLYVVVSGLVVLSIENYYGNSLSASVYISNLEYLIHFFFVSKLIVFISTEFNPIQFNIISISFLKYNIHRRVNIDDFN